MRHPVLLITTLSTAFLALVMLPAVLREPESGSLPRLQHHAQVTNESATDALVQVRLDGTEVCLVELGPGAQAGCGGPYATGNRTWVVAVDFGSGFTEYRLRSAVADPHFLVGRFSVSLDE